MLCAWKTSNKPVHVLGGLFGFLLEIDFVAAGAERRGGRVSQAFDGFGLLVVDVDQVLVEDAENAVGAAVDFLDALVSARLPGSLQRGWR